MYSQVMGPYYLKQQEYSEGIEAFTTRLKENPQDHVAAFYIGRYHLALNKPDKALPYLQKAAAMAPDNADYRFWIGVAHWAKLDFAEERKAYKAALKLDPDHISANLYLGHGYVDEGQWAKALARYDKVIELDPYNPEALYNRSVALEGLGKKAEEIAALKKFLEYYPDGSLAMRAATRLNLLGDFTYRNAIIGKRNVTIKSVVFKPGTDELVYESKESLQVVSAMMEVNDKLALHIVAYKDGDVAAAKARAHNVRNALLAGHPGISPSRLPLSWFGSAEPYELEGKSFSIKDSVQFITVTK
ncbi:tetratricopeptide repeat protein [Pseudodesulfovibrio cashew]|uniref:Tetratricopeptide repeat protein n=2 Tax=Pseudodesulfovibrio cashew TaxID=2678688 RepID=A0A6I6JGF3_9BACT|nr:tetratricopeptide repeat protein [Pseudodesulfovibrio cashew]